MTVKKTVKKTVYMPNELSRPFFQILAKKEKSNANNGNLTLKRRL